jgi:hypothetical protein
MYRLKTNTFSPPPLQHSDLIPNYSKEQGFSAIGGPSFAHTFLSQKSADYTLATTRLLDRLTGTQTQCSLFKNCAHNPLSLTFSQVTYITTLTYSTLPLYHHGVHLSPLLLSMQTTTSSRILSTRLLTLCQPTPCSLPLILHATAALPCETQLSTRLTLCQPTPCSLPLILHATAALAYETELLMQLPPTLSHSHHDLYTMPNTESLLDMNECYSYHHNMRSPSITGKQSLYAFSKYSDIIFLLSFAP